METPKKIGKQRASSILSGIKMNPPTIKEIQLINGISQKNLLAIKIMKIRHDFQENLFS